jgi:hypothetical protein
MGAILDKLNDEPVLFYQFIQAVITLIVAFGLKLTPEQIGAILLVTGAFLSIVTRGKVTPAAKP